MEIKVYLDTLFLINFFMDYVLLYITTKLIKRKVRILRLFFASVFGALYGVFSFFMPLSSYIGIFFKIAAGLVMVFISFKSSGIISFIKHSCIFFAVSFCCGGLAFSLLYYTNLGSLIGMIVSGGTIYLNIPIYKLILVCAASYGILTIFNIAAEKYRKRSGFICDVTLFYGEKSISLKALFDSGNCLTDPVSGLGVLVVQRTSLGALFAPDMTTDEFLIKNKSISITIPYKSVAGYNTMKGFIPDKTVVDGKSVKLCVGISETKFGDDFDALLPNNFDERTDQLEFFNTGAC